MRRKEFITGLGSLGFGIACASLLNACSKKNDNESETTPNNNNSGTIDFTIDLNDAANASLNNSGGFVNILVSNTAIVVINTGTGVFTALSRICSHANCLVNYDSPSQKLPCPCHGSKFDINGTVLNGPATLPLIKFNTSLNGNLLRIFKA